MRRVLQVLFIALLVCSAYGCTGTFSDQVSVGLYGRGYRFQGDSSPVAELAADKCEGFLDAGTGKLESFTLKFSVSVEFPVKDVNLLEIPGLLCVKLRQHDPSDWGRQNYPSFPMPDGTVPVLEASLDLGQDMTVGIPLAVLDSPDGLHEVVLDFSEVRWTMYVDGILMDNDFALGYPDVKGRIAWSKAPDAVREASLWIPGLEALHDTAIESNDALDALSSKEIQYWTPPYHNAWVGDVAAIWYNGRYHLFYLFDRRGHASKFGKGGHYFEHLSTADFKTWTEHEASTPIEEQWETFGTGTPFIWKDSLYLSYGLHSTRIYSREETSLPEQWDFFNLNGRTGFFSFDDPAGKVPDGTTWSVCTDGLSRFEKSRKIAHPCENPSIFTDSEGNLKMLANYGAKGTWRSDGIDGGWECLDPDFPPGGDCTFPFSWGGYDYIVGGFTSLWGRPSGRQDLQWKDMVASGEDFYNGISVPSVTVLEDRRCIMAGWLKMRSWAGALIIYELVQLQDGALGSKWVDELVPATEGKNLHAGDIESVADFTASSRSFLLTFEVDPDNTGEGNCSVGFIPESEGDPCFWKIDFGECRAQYSTSPEEREKTQAEGCRVANAGNYAVKNGMELDKPFTVRIAVKWNPKFNGSIIDAEIGGIRTMVSFRKGLEVNGLHFSADGCRIKNVNISKLSD